MGGFEDLPLIKHSAAKRGRFSEGEVENREREDLGILAFVEDINEEGGRFRIDIQGEVLTVGGDIGELEVDSGTREVVFTGCDGLVTIQGVEREDRIGHRENTGELQFQVVIGTGEPREERVPPRQFDGRIFLRRQDGDALLEGALKLLRFQGIVAKVFLTRLCLKGTGIALATTQEAQGMRLLIVDIIHPADTVIGHSNGTDTCDIPVRLSRITERDSIKVSRGMLSNDIRRMRHLDDIILVLVHIRVVDAEEDPHILQVEVRAVIKLHPHHVITIPEEPLRLRFDAHIKIRRLQEEAFKSPVEVLLAELHIREQLIIDALIATTEEMVIDLLTAPVHLTLVSIIFRLQEVGREEAIALHGRGIEASQVLSLRRPCEVVTSVIAVEHIRELCRLTGILHTGLMEAAHRRLFIAQLLKQEALKDQGRSSAGGIEGGVAREKG